MKTFPRVKKDFVHGCTFRIFWINVCFVSLFSLSFLIYDMISLLLHYYFLTNVKRLYNFSEIWPKILSLHEYFCSVHFSTFISCLSISNRAGGEKAVPSRLHRPGSKLMTVLYSLSSLWLTFLIAIHCIFHTFVTLPFVFAFPCCCSLILYTGLILINACTTDVYHLYSCLRCKLEQPRNTSDPTFLWYFAPV